MLKFETTSGQVEVNYHPKIETSSGQALVPIYKHIQTLENSKNINKREIIKNSNFEDFENENKQSPTVPNTDNLKTTKKKITTNPFSHLRNQNK